MCHWDCKEIITIKDNSNYFSSMPYVPTHLGALIMKDLGHFWHSVGG